MKRRIHSIRNTGFVIALLVCFSLPTFASTLTLPDNLEMIEEEAFYGDTSIDVVVISEQTKEIASKAFAGSTLTEINLPDTLSYIADDALPEPGTVSVSVNNDTYAYRWACRNGYVPHDHVWDNGEIIEYPQDGNEGKYTSKCIVCDALYEDYIPSDVPISIEFCDRSNNPLGDEIVCQDELTLYVKLTPAGGEDVEPDPGSIIWESSDDSVAFIGLSDYSSYGYVYFSQDGTTTITAIADRGKAHASITITAIHNELYESKVASALSLIDDTMTERQKAWVLYNWLIDNCYYDMVLYLGKPWASGWGYSAYGAIALGKAVCEGYADAMYVLLEKAGIWVDIVSGIVKGEGHAWNIVRIDGEYFFLDATLGDSTARYGYFLKDTMNGCSVSDYVANMEPES